MIINNILDDRAFPRDIINFGYENDSSVKKMKFEGFDPEIKYEQYIYVITTNVVERDGKNMFLVSEGKCVYPYSVEEINLPQYGTNAYIVGINPLRYNVYNSKECFTGFVFGNPEPYSLEQLKKLSIEQNGMEYCLGHKENKIEEDDKTADERIKSLSNVILKKREALHISEGNSSSPSFKSGKGSKNASGVNFTEIPIDDPRPFKQILKTL